MSRVLWGAAAALGLAVVLLLIRSNMGPPKSTEAKSKKQAVQQVGNAKSTASEEKSKSTTALPPTHRRAMRATDALPDRLEYIQFNLNAKLAMVDYFDGKRRRTLHLRKGDSVEDAKVHSVGPNALVLIHDQKETAIPLLGIDAVAPPIVRPYDTSPDKVPVVYIEGYDSVRARRGVEDMKSLPKSGGGGGRGDGSGGGRRRAKKRRGGNSESESLN